MGGFWRDDICMPLMKAAWGGIVFSVIAIILSALRSGEIIQESA
jgi:hypothetical protein